MWKGKKKKDRTEFLARVIRIWCWDRCGVEEEESNKMYKHWK